ncbi:MAG TPA: nicotinate (nicotinamide) nucleotide adenylyltransferase [Deltaproteobacteria bacterium]|nr:nicotinate (nicotinamide) nucleotide adenylyltransferase [Deltaproteobacteria bacterium]
MRLGLFGGTFNPLHIGHLRVAEEVREKVRLDTIIFVPSYVPPHKELDCNVSGQQRLEIIQRSIRANPFFEASSYEVERSEPSYSIRTIEHFRSGNHVAPFFILGQDAFNEIATWYEAERLFSLAHFIVMSRPGEEKLNLDQVLGTSSSLYRPSVNGFINVHGNEILFIDVTPFSLSSSQIRSNRKEGKSIRYLVPEEAYEYIMTERIYG